VSQQADLQVAASAVAAATTAAAGIQSAAAAFRTIVECLKLQERVSAPPTQVILPITGTVCNYLFFLTYRC
jgi:hypothetical protein